MSLPASSIAADKYPKLALHAPPSSLGSLSRPSTPPLTQPPSRFATIEQFEQLQSGQASIASQLSALAGALAKPAARRGVAAAASSGDDDGEEELETTVTLGAGHTPLPRVLRRSKARRVSLEQRGQRAQSAASSANREVLGLDEERLRSTGDFLSAIADNMDEEEDDDDAADASERKVNHSQHNRNETEHSSRKRVIVKRADKRAAASSSAASSALHPDLFSPRYDEAESVVSLLSKSLSAGVKSKKKFSDKKQLLDLLAKGREHAIDADGLTEVLASSNTAAWLEYETYLWQLLVEKGWEAADWYHRALFERINLGRHDLIRDGPVNSELIRDLDRQYSWLAESQLQSRKPTSSSSDRFRAKNNSGGGSGSGSNSGSSGKTAKQSAFTGVPCKHHGASARHTTAECRDPKAAGAASSSSA
jgi:hypothetical protein